MAHCDEIISTNSGNKAFSLLKSVEEIVVNDEAESE